MISEIKAIWKYDPITIDWVEIAIIAFIIIYVGMIFYIMINHGHQFSMDTNTIPFGSGHMANGDIYRYDLL